ASVGHRDDVVAGRRAGAEAWSAAAVVAGAARGGVELLIALVDLLQRAADAQVTHAARHVATVSQAPWPSLARRRAQNTSRGGTVQRALVGHRSNLRLGSPRRVAPPRTVTLLEARGGRPPQLPLERAPFRSPAPHHPVDVPEGVPGAL